MTGAALGVDVGGANVKFAVAVSGEVRESGVVPLPLWDRPEDLPARLAELPERSEGARVGLCMSGELADCFEDRESGVRAIVDAAAGVWPAGRLHVLCSDGAWRRPGEVRSRPRSAAAANWLPPALLLARSGEEGLLADMGSTTTDLVPVTGEGVGSGARTDLERLRAGELVYTGLLRTPVCAMIARFRPEPAQPPIPLAGERFAIAADVHLWLGSIDPGEYRWETPDGGPKSREGAGRRLARMACSDPEELGEDGLRRLARQAADAQARRIVEAIGRQRARLGGRFPRRGWATGAGASVMAALLRRAGLALADPPPALGGEHAAAATAAAAAILVGEAPASRDGPT